MRRRARHDRSGPGPAGIAILLAIAALLAAASGPAEARSKRRMPPDVVLHPDRGMGISRFSKASHDQRLFKSLNDATRLPLRDPALDPYNLVDRGTSTYDIQTGQIHGSLTDHYAAIRRGEETERRNRQQRARLDKAASPEGVESLLSKFKSTSSRATVPTGSGSRSSRSTAGPDAPAR